MYLIYTKQGMPITSLLYFKKWEIINLTKGIGRQIGGRNGKKTSSYPMKKRCSFCKKLARNEFDKKFYCKFHYINIDA